PVSIISSVLSNHLLLHPLQLSVCFFFFKYPPPTDIYTLSLHERSSDLSHRLGDLFQRAAFGATGESDRRIHNRGRDGRPAPHRADRKSTRLNSSHDQISYAVFCLKKKKHKEKALIL